MTLTWPRLGFGGAPIGNLFHPVDDDRAAATVEAAWHCGIRYFDTACHFVVAPRQLRTLPASAGRVLRAAGAPLTVRVGRAQGLSR